MIIEARTERDLVNGLGDIDRCLGDRTWLRGSGLSGADIQLSFVGELAGRRADRSRYPNLEAGCPGRPAYLAAVSRGAYALVE